MTLTAERPRELMTYDPLTGQFAWRLSRRGASAGRQAGSLDRDGYVRITVDRQRHPAHRLAWLWMTGAWPDDEVDHVNTARNDNRWANLRAATCSQNGANSGKQSNNTSGFKGVSWHRRAGRWEAQIQVRGEKKHLGSFDSAEEAHAAYIAAATELFGQFARAA